jgi:hypothetical protein
MRVTIDGRRGVVVSVPSSSRRGWARPDPAVERFLRDREAWIRGHLVRRDRERAALVARGGLADGSAFRYRGVLHALSVTDSDGGPTIVERIGDDDVDAIVVRLGPRDSHRLSAVLRDWLKRRARAAIAHEIDRHREPLGVPGPTAIAIRDPRSRWASASRDGRLMFSWRLVLAPPEALETVVIHELAHLRVFGHGPAFWELVAARRPDHAEWRRWLRRHSYELHHALDDAGDGASLGVG